MDFGVILLLENLEEEEFVETTVGVRRNSLMTHRRRIRDANNPLELSEERFTTLFRISKEIALILIQSIESDVKRSRSHGLPVQIIVLTAVRFYAVGSYQRCIGQEYNLALEQKTVSKVVKEVSRAIVCRLFHVYIQFPSTVAERRAVASGFYQKHGIPACLGCIDGTHISIVTPYNNNPNDPPIGYKNRKGNYSINTQFICDSNLKLLNVNARFPGLTHDQHIFNNSNVKTEMARLVTERIGKFYLIGDSGYAKESFMLTPILPAPPERSAEMIYNKKICKVRNCIERTNGVIKAIFRCLHKDRVLHYQPEAAACIISSCCTIYNMMHHYRFTLPEMLEDVNTEEGDPLSVVASQTPRSAALQRQLEIVNLINNISIQ